MTTDRVVSPPRSDRRWLVVWALCAAGAGVLIAVGARPEPGWLVVLLTALLAGAVSGFAVWVGAVRLRRVGERVNWRNVIAWGVGALGAGAILILDSGRGLLMTGAQSFNGGILGVSIFALTRSGRRQRQSAAGRGDRARPRQS